MITEVINQIIGLGKWDADLKTVIPTTWQDKDYIILFKKNAHSSISCRLKRGAKRLFFQLPDKTFTKEIMFPGQVNQETRATAYQILKRIINKQPISNLSYPSDKFLPIGEEIVLQIGIKNGVDNATKS